MPSCKRHNDEDAKARGKAFVCLRVAVGDKWWYCAGGWNPDRPRLAVHA